MQGKGGGELCRSSCIVRHADISDRSIKRHAGTSEKDRGWSTRFSCEGDNRCTASHGWWLPQHMQPMKGATRCAFIQPSPQSTAIQCAT